MWRRLADATGASALLALRGAGRSERREREAEIMAAVREWCAASPARSLVDRLQSVGVAAERLLWPRDAYEDPQFQARSFYQGLYHPRFGFHPYPGFPYGEPLVPKRNHVRRTPLLGEHNEQILRAVLGLDDAEIGKLDELQVIGARPVIGT
jgi:crotonobetainyl-CoA:carnitine CoA-transferase CaiB-like acyl-CoA transferase